MTIVYVPRLIESAEQAETLLPSGTEFIVMRSYDDPAEGTWTYAYDHNFPRSWFPFMALAPIEAEEEKRSVARHSGGGQTNYNTEAAGNPGRMGEYIAGLPVESRYVTPWESV